MNCPRHSNISINCAHQVAPICGTRPRISSANFAGHRMKRVRRLSFGLEHTRVMFLLRSALRMGLKPERARLRMQARRRSRESPTRRVRPMTDIPPLVHLAGTARQMEEWAYRCQEHLDSPELSSEFAYENTRITLRLFLDALESAIVEARKVL